VLRLDEMPRVEVHIMPSSEPPTGVGEPGVPPIGPAVGNALAALTGRRFRRAELLLPDVNACAAAEHLARDLAACGGRQVGALGRYSRGHGCSGNKYARAVLTEVLP
jgi:hypothetical protein